MLDGQRINERTEHKDMIAYVSLIIKLCSVISLHRVVNVPKRRVVATSVDRLNTNAAEHHISLYEAEKEVDFTEITKRTANTVAEYQQMIENFNHQQEFLTATDLVEEVLEKTGYIESLKKDRTIE